MKTVYDFTVKDRMGNEVSLSEYKGKVLLIVNTATGCGFTPHYEPLEAMYKDMKDQGLEILDFPCNQFANQAPGDADEIHQFCTLKFGADFPQFAKIDVNGENAEPLYAWLATEKPFAGFGKGLKNAALSKFADMNNKAFGDKAYIKWTRLPRKNDHPDQHHRDCCQCFPRCFQGGDRPDEPFHRHRAGRGQQHLGCRQLSHYHHRHQAGRHGAG